MCVMCVCVSDYLLIVYYCCGIIIVYSVCVLLCVCVTVCIKRMYIDDIVWLLNIIIIIVYYGV